MIRALIIEDEPAAAKRVESMVLRAGMEIQICGILDSIESSVNWFNNNEHPDLIFLDIELADGKSFEIFRHVKVDSFIIFTTAYDAYAVKAFELNSVDYLLKPIDESKLKTALQKFRLFAGKNKKDSLAELFETLDLQKNSWKKRFLVYAGNVIKSIETKDIAFFYSLEKGSFLCTNENRHYQVEYSLDKLEQILDNQKFFRINRQQMVCFDSIKKLHVLSKSRIKIEIVPEQKEEFIVSSSKTHLFRQWLDK
jgi:two-component system, LytTR family, response regulator LytT